MLYSVVVPVLHRVEPKDRAFGKAEKLKSKRGNAERIADYGGELNGIHSGIIVNPSLCAQRARFWSKVTMVTWLGWSPASTMAAAS